MLCIPMKPNHATIPNMVVAAELARWFPTWRRFLKTGRLCRSRLVGWLVGCVGPWISFPAVSSWNLASRQPSVIVWLIYHLPMHRRAMAARGELCYQRDCRVVSLSTRHSLDVFVLEHFVISSWNFLFGQSPVIVCCGYCVSLCQKVLLAEQHSATREVAMLCEQYAVCLNVCEPTIFISHCRIQAAFFRYPIVDTRNTAK